MMMIKVEVFSVDPLYNSPLSRLQHEAIKFYSFKKLMQYRNILINTKLANCNMTFEDDEIDDSGSGRYRNITLANGSIDECGTGRYTPPTKYQNVSTQDVYARMGNLLDPRLSSSSYFSKDSYNLDEIVRNTEKSAETLQKIHENLEVEDGVTNTLRAIRQMLEVENGITKTLRSIYRMLKVQDSFIPNFTFLIVLEFIFAFVNLMYLPTSFTSTVNEVKTVKTLNVTEDMQIFLDLARTNMLEDLKYCISQYL